MSNKISENLKKLRNTKDYSLEKVARLADLSLNTIVKIENGVNQNPTMARQIGGCPLRGDLQPCVARRRSHYCWI